MEIFALTFIVFAVAAIAMALGAIVGRPPLRSGCASVAHIEDGTIRCALCGGCSGASQYDPERLGE